MEDAHVYVRGLHGNGEQVGGKTTEGENKGEKNRTLYSYTWSHFHSDSHGANCVALGVAGLVYV